MQPKTSDVKTGSPKSVSSSSAKTTDATSTKTPADTIVDWKTYSDSNKVYATFKYPTDWMEATSWNALNAVAFTSPELTPFKGFGHIESGSTLSVTFGDKKWHQSSLDDAVQVISNVADNPREYITLDGAPAVKFKHGTQEDQSSAMSVYALDKDGNSYLITQMYKLDAINPFPDLIDSVVKTFRFNK